MMRRREIITLLGGAAAALPRAARAQQQRRPVIGYLSLATPGGSAAPPTFMQGLAETGSIVGQNVAIEYRWAETLLRRRKFYHPLGDDHDAPRRSMTAWGT